MLALKVVFLFIKVMMKVAKLLDGQSSSTQCLLDYPALRTRQEVASTTSRCCCSTMFALCVVVV